MKNNKGLIPMVLAFHAIFIYTGLICLWHLPARQEKRREIRIQRDALNIPKQSANYTQNFTTR